MQRRDVTITTPDGECPTVIVTPDGDGPWAPVIVFMDAGGIRPAMVEMAERLAGMGYLAFLPDMYYRHGPYEPFDFATVFGDEDERTRLFGMLTSLTKAMAASDTGDFLEYLDQLPEADASQVGVTGYCMGGGLSLTAAAHHPDRIVAVASFHGGNLANDASDSPHLIADRIRGRVYIGVAQNDGSFPAEQEARLGKVLSDAGIDHTMETYPAAHGFAVRDNPSYDAASAERHWDVLDDLLGSMLS